MKPLTAALLLEVLALVVGNLLVVTFLRRRREGRPTGALRPVALAFLAAAVLGAVAVIYLAFV